MNKKTLGIILAVLVVAIAGMIYFGFKKGIGEIGKKSMMDATREQGQIIPSKTDAAKECEKSTDQGEKDTCYGILAFYYRDSSFCKYVKDPEMKSKCTKENIEKWYSEVGKGGATSPFMPGGLTPGGGMIPGGETGGGIEGGGNVGNVEPGSIPPDTSGQTVKPSGKMTDEIYIEILAQSGYYAQKSPENFASHMKDLYAQYGITEEDIRAYGAELEKNPQRAGEIGLKYMQRAQELQATGK